MTPETNHEKRLMLITGGSGLIGTRLTKGFADDFRVISLDVKEPDEAVEPAEFVQCDLTKDESVSSALDQRADEHGTRIASVIHPAADDETPVLVEEITVRVYRPEDLPPDTTVFVEGPPGKLPPVARLAERAGFVVKHADVDPQPR